MHHGEEDDALPGQDSFIDVVCNMVGILIVLVMIVGVRASSAGSESTSDMSRRQISPAANNQREKSIDADLDKTEHQVAEAAHEINRAVAQLSDLARQAALIEARRHDLSVVRAEVEQDIDRRRSKLDAEGQRRFDAQRKIAEMEIKLHQLTQEQISLLAQPAKVETIECVPTPIGKEIGDDAIYVRLHHGQLAVVPVEELMLEASRRDSDYIRSSLEHRNHADDTYGPIDGFRIRVFVARADKDKQIVTRDGELVSTYSWCVIVPNAENIGQPVEQALLPDSKFMSKLRARRATPTVMAWVYGDSFDELRTLKRAMWDAGIPLGVKPLPDGAPIGFAPDGVRVVAQ